MVTLKFAIHVVLDEFDFGIGMLSQLIARTKTENGVDLYRSGMERQQGVAVATGNALFFA